MGASSPSRSREPQNAVTKLKDSASAARTGRSRLRGIRRLWAGANLNAQNSRYMLRRKWLGGAPREPHTTKTRDSTRPLVQRVSLGFYMPKNPRNISANAESSYTATQAEKVGATRATTIKSKQATIFDKMITVTNMKLNRKTTGLHQITVITDLNYFENSTAAEKLQTFQTLQLLQILLK